MSGRIRSIKPEWLEDEDLASLSDTARMVSVSLIVLADDYGNGRAHPLFLASRIWPYASGDPAETLAKLSRALHELSEAGFVLLYRVAGQQYFNIRNWSKHQRVDRPSKPRIPGPDKDDGLPLEPGNCAGHANGSRDPGETLAQPSRDPRSGSGSGSGILDQGEDLRAREDSRESQEPWTERDQSELDALDPPDAPPPDADPPLHVALWTVWGEVAHGGLPAGSPPRSQLLECCDVLRARSASVDRFREVATAWVHAKRSRGALAKFVFFAQDLAGLLDAQRATTPPAPVIEAHKPFPRLEVPS